MNNNNGCTIDTFMQVSTALVLFSALGFAPQCAVLFHKIHHSTHYIIKSFINGGEWS